jgi:hypothetical protein
MSLIAIPSVPDDDDDDDENYSLPQVLSQLRGVGVARPGTTGVISSFDGDVNRVIGSAIRKKTAGTFTSSDDSDDSAIVNIDSDDDEDSSSLEKGQFYLLSKGGGSLKLMRYEGRGRFRQLKLDPDACQAIHRGVKQTKTAANSSMRRGQVD